MQLVERFSVFFLSTLALELRCGVIPSSACGHPLEFAPGGLGSAPVRTGCGSGRAACVMGTLAALHAQEAGGHEHMRYGAVSFFCPPAALAQ